jgi:hypothetical protein
MGRARQQPSIKDSLIGEGGDVSDDDNEDAAVLGWRTRPWWWYVMRIRSLTLRARSRKENVNANRKKRDSGEGEGNTGISC